MMLKERRRKEIPLFPSFLFLYLELYSVLHYICSCCLFIFYSRWIAGVEEEMVGMGLTDSDWLDTNRPRDALTYSHWEGQ